MIMNHLNLTVTDVSAAREFLEKYFKMTSEDGYNDGFGVMRDDYGFVLTLMRGKSVDYPKTFHIGFGQESEEKVDEIYRRMKADGIDVMAPVHSHGYTFYVEAPGGFTVEVLT